MRHSFVRAKDVRRLLEIVNEPAVDEPTDLFYMSVLTGLIELVPTTVAMFRLRDIPRRRDFGLGLDVEEELAGPFDDDESDIHDPWTEFRWSPEGCAGLSQRMNHTGVVAKPMARPESGLEHELIAVLPPRGGVVRALELFRDTPYDDREVDLFRLVRPHLVELADRRLGELAHRPVLTQRQWEILHGVAAGATNLQIAHRLGTAESTVRKHLENVFERLGVTSRTEAVLMTWEHLDQTVVADWRHVHR